MHVFNIMLMVYSYYMYRRVKTQKGFTIVELLIVIVVIGILAAITIVAYNGIQDRANTAKITSDQRNIATAIKAAQSQTGKPMKDIVLDSYIGSGCASVVAGTDLATLDKATHSCWTKYTAALDKISVAGNMNIRNLVDPWGRPYWIDSNEAESSPTDCRHDDLAVYARPTNATSRTNIVYLPFTNTGCV